MGIKNRLVKKNSRKDIIKISSNSMTYPKVSIIILNWNNYEDTKECLLSLDKITYPNYEVIVVDNGSEGNDAVILEEQYKDYINVIRNKENLGFAKGNNIAIKQVLKEWKSDYILLLNNDTVVEPDFLERLIEIGEEDESIGILGPKIYFYNTPNIIQCFGGKINLWLGRTPGIGFGKKDGSRYQKNRLADSVSGAAMLIKKDVIQKVGLFDEKIFLYWEDADYYMRVLKQGWKIMAVSSSHVYHKGQSSIPNPVFWYFITKNNRYFMKKHTHFYQLLTFYPIYFFTVLLRIIRLLKARHFKCIPFLVRGFLE